MVDWVRDGEAAPSASCARRPMRLQCWTLACPGLDGLEVLARARAAGCTVPVLVLTARDAVPDRIRGLDGGADDYVVKPVDLFELGARLRAWCGAHGQAQEQLVWQDVVLDPAARRVTQAGVEVPLSGREFDLLALLMRHQGRAKPRAAGGPALRLGPGGGEQCHRGPCAPPAAQARGGADRDRARRGLQSAQGMKGLFGSPQARLLAGLLAVALGVGGVMTLLMLRSTEHELDELLDAHLTQTAALLVVQHSQRHRTMTSRCSTRQLAPLCAACGVPGLPRGQLALRSSEAPLEPLVEGMAGMAGMASGFHRVERGGTGWRVFVTRGASADVAVLVGERESARREILWAVLAPLLGGAAAAAALVALLGAAVLHWGLAPLRRLRMELAARQPAQLGPVELPDAPAEIAPLVASLNGLFTRIEALLEGERRLTADAAHELRTPIAVIRAQAQVALGAAEPDERRHALQALLAGCDRAARLIEQLLQLARLESSAGLALPHQALNLADLVARAVAEAAESAQHQGPRVGARPAAPRCAGDRLRRPAVDPGPATQPARQRAALQPARQRRDGHAGGRHTAWRLTVEDAGPGLDDQALARLGQRFQRGPDPAAPGSGLGWSIVQRIAALQGWQVAADRSPELAGLRVSVQGEAVG